MAWLCIVFSIIFGLVASWNALEREPDLALWNLWAVFALTWAGVVVGLYMLVGHKTSLSDDRVSQARPVFGARVLMLDEIDSVALTSFQNYLGMRIPKVEIRGRRSVIKLMSSFYTDRKLAELVNELQRRGVRVTKEAMLWVDWAQR